MYVFFASNVFSWTRNQTPFFPSNAWETESLLFLEVVNKLKWFKECQLLSNWEWKERRPPSTPYFKQIYSWWDLLCNKSLLWQGYSRVKSLLVELLPNTKSPSHVFHTPLALLQGEGLIPVIHCQCAWWNLHEQRASALTITPLFCSSQYVVLRCTARFKIRQSWSAIWDHPQTLFTNFWEAILNHKPSAVREDALRLSAPTQWGGDHRNLRQAQISDLF